MQKDRSQDLKNIAAEILNYFRTSSSQAVQALLRFEDYHGFQKSRLPDTFVRTILKPFGYQPEDLQIEVIWVVSDLRHELHYHKNSFAFLHILGSGDHFNNPKRAFGYNDRAWISLQAGDEWLIPPKTTHGFTVDPGGVMYFLSIQYPPIVYGAVDDYHRVNAEG